MRTWTTHDGAEIAASGTPMVRRPNPVYMKLASEAGEVDTDRGTVSVKAGDFVAYDPMSEQVWPVAADYVETHYDEWPGE